MKKKTWTKKSININYQLIKYHEVWEWFSLTVATVICSVLLVHTLWSQGSHLPTDGSPHGRPCSQTSNTSHRIHNKIQVLWPETPAFGQNPEFLPLWSQSWVGDKQESRWTNNERCLAKRRDQCAGALYWEYLKLPVWAVKDKVFSVGGYS